MDSVYIDKKGLSLDVQGLALIVREKSEKTKSIPLATVKRIFLRGEVNYSARLLAKLGDLGIGVVWLAGWHSKPTLFLPRPHHDATRRLRQFAHYQNKAYRLAEAQEILRLKLEAQIQHLENALIQYPESRYPLTHALKQLEPFRETLTRHTELNALMGWEGASAQIYYKALGACFPSWVDFSGRNRRPPRDPANVLMSLAYTLLHAEAVLTAYGAGFDPDIGMLHAVSFNRESFACDLIEPLRPSADQWIAEKLHEGVFSAADFSIDEDSQACCFSKEGRLRFYAEWEKCAPDLRNQLKAICTAFLTRVECRECNV